MGADAVTNLSGGSPNGSGQASQFSRRGWLQFGGVSLWSAGLLNVIRGRAQAAQTGQRRIRGCLFLFQIGGISQTDTVDMKPDLDDTIRGEFKPIATNVPGMLVCEHMPHVARHMDKVRVVRTVHHRMLCHNPAIYAALSGREVGESLAVSNKTFASRSDFPHVGSGVASQIAAPENLPPFVAFPYRMRNGPAPSPGQHAGFLGALHDPLLVTADPSAADFQVDELAAPADIAPIRLSDRQQLLGQVDADFRLGDQLLESMNEYQRRAFNLLNTPRTRQAFDVSQESEATREAYGRNVVGQSYLLGRRLVEAGVPFVSVYSPVANVDDPSWDTHQNNFPRLKNELLPPADRALAALLDDMHARGLLDDILVAWVTEFGRTPKIGVIRSNNTNNVTGRDHWPGCYSVVLAGGGVPGGCYFGSSDRLGWYPKENPIHVADLIATFYDAFGIDPRGTIHDSLGRPFVLSEGTPVAGIWTA